MITYICISQIIQANNKINFHVGRLGQMTSK